ncbi:hypothetical protein HD841_000901 [Sphingomonas melonis]|uniref:Uncharacterized protein n=1 Tax=Sphingomonas melonis TaxID=152682 RepID=A0A7Y9K0Q6_9SPHN|nr:hypothetical protein [Sphingomonas melonis]
MAHDLGTGREPNRSRIAHPDIPRLSFGKLGIELDQITPANAEHRRPHLRGVSWSDRPLEHAPGNRRAYDEAAAADLEVLQLGTRHGDLSAPGTRGKPSLRDRLVGKNALVIQPTDAIRLGPAAFGRDLLLREGRFGLQDLWAQQRIVEHG